MLKISIIMPAYNSEDFIERSVSSVLAQTYSNIELIIINDGSVDGTEKKVHSFIEEDKRIKYYKIENSGSAVARNVGLDNATGDYIAFVDSDDFINKNMMKTLINKSIEYDSDIVSCSYEWVYPNKTEPEKTYLSEGYYSKKDLKELVYPQVISTKSLKATVPKSMWTKLYKRSLIEENYIRFTPDLRMMQDIVFSINCLLVAESFYFLPDEKLYKYISNKDSRTNTYLSNAWTVFKSGISQFKKMAEEFPEYSLENQLPYTLISHSMSAIANIGKKGNTKNKKEKIKEIKEIVTDKDLQLAIDKIDTNKLSPVRKILIFLIKHRKTNAIYLAIIAKYKGF